MSAPQQYYLALDLKDDPQLIETYLQYHRPENVWPEITADIRASGVLNMEIYRVANRLFMIMTVEDDFSFEAKAEADAADPKVKEWETLMATFQQTLPGAPEGSKWQRLERIFNLVECP